MNRRIAYRGIFDTGIVEGALSLVDAGPPGAKLVLLLHDEHETSRVWLELGTVDALLEEGYRVWAVDLPGHGDSDAPSLDVSRQRVEHPISMAEVVRRLLPRLIVSPDLKAVLPRPAHRPVVASPPAGTPYLLSLIAVHRMIITAAQHVSGLVTIGPTTLEADKDHARRYPRLPTLHVWGARDDEIARVGELESRFDGRTVIVDDAARAVHRDNPAEFRRLLVEFLHGVPFSPYRGDKVQSIHARRRRMREH